MGLTTVIPFASFYFVLAAALLLGPLAGGLVGGSYGLGRALPVPIASLALLLGAGYVEMGRWLALGSARLLARRGCALGLLAIVAALLLYA